MNTFSGAYNELLSLGGTKSLESTCLSIFYNIITFLRRGFSFLNPCQQD